MRPFSQRRIRARTAILLRTRDRPLFLRRALDSILGQHDQDWCIALIHDGGDSSALEDSLAPFQARLEGRLAVVHFEKSEGRGTGRHLNAGIQATESSFIAIHDDDDSWEPGFLERARAHLGEKSAVVTQSLLIREILDGTELRELSRELYEPWQKYEISLFRLAESLSFPPIALLFRRSVIDLIGGFDDELGPLEDWEFALRLFSRFEVPFLEEPLAHYRQRESGENGAAANSRSSSSRRYGELDARIRNKLLREDLARGRLGLGFLVNLAQGHGRLFSELLQLKNGR